MLHILLEPGGVLGVREEKGELVMNTLPRSESWNEDGYSTRHVS